MGEADFQIGTARRTESLENKTGDPNFWSRSFFFSLTPPGFSPSSRGVGWKYVYRLVNNR